jgi:hypothetical protein
LALMMGCAIAGGLLVLRAPAAPPTVKRRP